MCPTTRKETLLTAILFDSHVLCDTSFILHEVCHKALKGSFTSLYMMGTLSLSIVSPQIERRRDSIHLLLYNNSFICVQRSSHTLWLCGTYDVPLTISCLLQIYKMPPISEIQIYVSFSCWGMEGCVGVLIFHVFFLGCKVLQSSALYLNTHILTQKIHLSANGVFHWSHEGLPPVELKKPWYLYYFHLHLDLNYTTN